MKAGVLGVLDGDFPRLEPYRGGRNVNGHDLTDQIDITGVARTPDGIDINEGVAAREEVATREAAAIEFDSISVESESDVVTRHTRFATVPGDLVVVANSKGLFFYDVLERAIGDAPERVSISLGDVLAAFPDASLWKAGFYDRDAGVENGVLHGADLQDDPAFSEYLADGSLNQLGMRVTVDETEYNLNVTESGYFEVYEPSDLDTKGFIRFIRNHLQPHFS
ncbi:MAG: hypothetical protein ACOCZD_00290 [Haloferacaceae archaeon]